MLGAGGRSTKEWGLIVNECRVSVGECEKVRGMEGDGDGRRVCMDVSHAIQPHTW